MSLYIQPNLLLSDTERIVPESVQWQSPSNIAIIKYWGKHGIQLPRNPNISFTLSEAHTQTKISYKRKEDAGQEIETTFLFDGEPNEAFKKRIDKFLKNVLIHFSFLSQLSLDIESTNSFPHSSGIASSASAMSALAMCLCSIENKLFNSLSDKKEFLKKASFIARLGSGSAARSVYPIASTWGHSDVYPDADDLFAIEANIGLHKSFTTLQDTILLVSKSEKSVSSSAGHALMDGNPFADIRYQAAGARLRSLQEAMMNGDWETFGKIAEQEALDLHALMMTSSPSYILLEPNTLEVIKRIKAIRQEQNLHVFFTLDAGPNVHVLYPEKEKEKVLAFINEELISFCQNGEHILDHAGPGPKLLNK